MEPIPAPRPELAGVLEDLIRREPIFHRPEWGTTRADFERMTTPDFWEVGASGRRYNWKYVLDELERRCQRKGHDPAPESLKASGFNCRRLSGSVYLLTYTLLQSDRITRRSTIWQKSMDGWKAVFHQGTVVQDDSTR